MKFLVPIVGAEEGQMWEDLSSEELESEWFWIKFRLFFLDSSLLLGALVLVLAIFGGIGGAEGFIIDYLI